MPAALSVLRYTERVAHLPCNEENYICHPNRGLPAHSVVNVVQAIFQLRLITPRVTTLREPQRKLPTLILRIFHCCRQRIFIFFAYI